MMFRPRIEKAMKVIEFVRGKDLPVKKQAVTDILFISYRSAEYIIRPLVKAGVLRATRGPAGGYNLAHPNITIGELAEIMGLTSDQYTDCFLTTRIEDIR